MDLSFAKRPRFRLITLMILIALIAIGLCVPLWLRDGLQDVWNGPVTIRIARDDTLESVLKRLKVATSGGFRLKTGMPIYVDPTGLQEAGVVLSTPVGVDLDARGVPASEVLTRILAPMGLACRARNGLVVISSKRALSP